jgi:hypothetical protein
MPVRIREHVSHRTWLLLPLASALAFLPVPEPILSGFWTGGLSGQGLEPSPEEREAARARQGAGVKAGAWLPADLHEASDAGYGTWPHLEGSYQRGLDRHVAIESTVALWRRTQTRGSEEVSTFVVPLLTSIKFYPGSGPDAGVQPHLLAGAGFGIGIDDRQGTSGGLLGIGGGDGTQMFLGFGLRAGAGVDLRLGQVFGVTIGGRYQWIPFDGDPGGNRTYGGPVFDLGLTYRFQY